MGQMSIDHRIPTLLSNDEFSAVLNVDIKNAREPDYHQKHMVIRSMIAIKL